MKTFLTRNGPLVLDPLLPPRETYTPLGPPPPYPGSPLSSSMDSTSTLGEGRMDVDGPPTSIASPTPQPFPKAGCSAASPSESGSEREGGPGAADESVETKYNLRKTSIVNRIETEKRRREPRQPKPKAKPPPLSKYRRKTANSRERGRMRMLNEAFESLQAALPSLMLEREGGKAKVTKFGTLRAALDYISGLQALLQSSEEGEGSDVTSDTSSTRAMSISSGDDGCVSPPPTSDPSLTPGGVEGLEATALQDFQLSSEDEANLAIDLDLMSSPGCFDDHLLLGDGC